jgi:hypothetical protein
MSESSGTPGANSSGVLQLLVRRWICAAAKKSNRQEKTMKAIGSTALRAGLPASILALACVSTAGSAVAQSRYDGSWSVAISTHRGACQSGLRYGMQILNGHVVSAAGGAAYVRGIVSPGGAVRVSVQSGGQWANGSGRLGVATGGGVWRGQGNPAPAREPGRRGA